MLTAIAGRALDLVVDVAGWHTDRVGDVCARAAVALEDAAEVLRLIATLTGACP